MTNEKWLIDANALIDKHTVLWDEALGFCACVLVEDIENAPTVDAVEVVRCKDCKYFYRHTQIDTDRGDCWKYGIANLRVKKIDNFCSYGERRTDERKAD